MAAVPFALVDQRLTGLGTCTDSQSNFLHSYWDKIGVSILCLIHPGFATVCPITFSSYNKSETAQLTQKQIKCIVIFMVAGTGIFGAFFLLLLIVADLIPQAMTAIPKCGIYITCNMLLVVFSLLFNTLVTSIHNTIEDKPMWRCVRPVSTFTLS